MELTQEKSSPILTSEESSEVMLLASTNKGGFIYYSDSKRKNWEVNGPYLLGSIVHHMVFDSRDGNTILMAAQTKNHGPCIFISTDFGMNWEPANFPSTFSNGDNIDHIFRLEIGHKSEPNIWYAGTSPQGLFKSDDCGKSWNEVQSLSEIIKGLNPNNSKKNIEYKYEKVHSICIDTKDKNHITIGMTNGGVFESDDAGNGTD